MEEQIGFQEISNESKDRKKVILKSYNIKEDIESEAVTFLYNIHYSNPAFTFNYLLRILPYSFLAIEFQGDDFDNPNRLFFSVEKSLKSSLANKSDLREMIPELYYMIDLFYNILFENLYDGSKIDYIEISEKDNFITEKDKRQNFYNYLCKMRNFLEEENNINKWINLIFGKKKNIIFLKVTNI